ncbi:MAG: HlyD family secretion protein [Pseudomonadota bacterium]
MSPSSHRPHARPATTRRRVRTFCAPLAALLLAACTAEPPQALGTLEYDHVTLTAPASERILAVLVREGERVRPGQPLLRVEPARTRAAEQAARADVERSRAQLDELREGPRAEAIARARAELAAARAQAREAQAYHARLQPLARQRLVAAADADRARAAAENAAARERAAEQALQELERGTRPEQIAQGEAALRAAEARATAQAVTLAKLTVSAPRAGRVDSLPYEPGDEPPAGAPLAVLQVGDRPHARIYVPQPLRAAVRVGTPVQVEVEGRRYAGRVRMIRNEPAFTPYYALIGEDVARLSYLAEVELTDPRADGLPAGLPVGVRFAAERARD